MGEAGKGGRGEHDPFRFFTHFYEVWIILT